MSAVVATRHHSLLLCLRVVQLLPRAAQVLSLEVDFVLEVRLDSSEATGHIPHSDFRPKDISCPRGVSPSGLPGLRRDASEGGPAGAQKGAKFEVAVLGDGCLPSMGFLQIKHLALQVAQSRRCSSNDSHHPQPRSEFAAKGCALHRVEQAHAKLWWDVFDKKFDLAFSRDDAARIDWDVELALGGCGLGLPDCIEDKFLSKLSEFVINSFTEQNPISIDLGKKKPDKKKGKAKDGDEAGSTSDGEDSS